MAEIIRQETKIFRDLETGIILNIQGEIAIKLTTEENNNLMKAVNKWKKLDEEESRSL